MLYQTQYLGAILIFLLIILILDYILAQFYCTSGFNGKTRNANYREVDNRQDIEMDRKDSLACLLFKEDSADNRKQLISLTLPSPEI